MDLVLKPFNLKEKEQVIDKYQEAKKQVKDLELAIEKMMLRKNMLKNLCEQFEEQTHKILKENGIKKIECGEYDVTVKKPSEKIKIISENDVPESFVELKEIIQKTIDKKSIKQWIRETGEIPSGVEVETGKKTILVKRRSA